MEPTLIHIQELLQSAQNSLHSAESLLRTLTGTSDASRERLSTRAPSLSSVAASGKIIEGIFDGQNMIDGDGQTYPVPANYASKSKLVEGDGMKLTITDEGKFVYKQIAPIARRSVLGTLIQEDGQYKILAEGKTYRILLASITFYRANVGDSLSILLPEDLEARWGAVDAVIPAHLSGSTKLSKTDGELHPSVENESHS